MLFIIVLFHWSPFKDFKHFWIHGVELKYRSRFRELPSYGRFFALMPRLFIPFCVLVHSLKSRILADKGYISPKFFAEL